MTSVVSRFSGFFLVASAALVLSLTAVGAKVYAAQAAAPDPNGPPEISPAISAKLSAFTEFQNKADWEGAMKLVNELEPLEATPYDKFFLSNLKWQIDLQNTKDPTSMVKALDPLLTALDLDEKSGGHFAEPADRERLLFTGSQLVYQSGADKPTAERIAANKKSIELMKKFLTTARNPTTENVRFYAALVMQSYADTDYPKGPDKDALLDEALTWAKKGITMWPTQANASLVPNEEFYVIMLSAYLAKEQDDDAIDTLELLVHRNPKNDKFWDRLTQILTTKAFQENEKTEGKDSGKAFTYFMKALSAYQRAQDNGFLNTPAANEMIVGIYGAMEQYGYAAETLEKDLKSGAIESKEDKWENAALYYRLDRREDKALTLLKDAATHFPNSGRLDYLAAVAYNQLDDYQNAYQLAVQSAKKGVGDKTWRSWALAAYAAFALNNREAALEAVNEALKDPASKEDPNLAPMKKAIETEIKDAVERAQNAAKMINGK